METAGAFSITGGVESPAEPVTEASLRELFERQVEAFLKDPNPDHRVREDRLRRLEQMLLENAEAIAEAIAADFGVRSRHETLMAEIFPGSEAARYARRRVRKWMRPQRRALPVWFFPGRAKVLWQPLGVVGIIVPWNYPVYLAAAPLAGALAAGNRAMVKMSEFVPRTGVLMARLVNRYFAPEELTVINGGTDVAQAFSALPFDHLLFTGSTRTGRAAMRAAAENLTPVTLELGGKSPVIIGPDFPISTAVASVMFGKCFNSSQTCIAPDYVLLPEGREQEFAEAARAEFHRLYPNWANNPDYTSIIDDRHFSRLLAWLEEARSKGARTVELAPAESAADPRSRKMAPVLLFDVTDEMQVMREEIFGPLLPVKTYHTLDEAIEFVRCRPRPLALYYFDNDRRRIDRVLRETISGGVTINDTMLHVAPESLPFGGVGPSGMGHYHGRDGFETFSKKKAVFIQSRWNGMAMLKPPYGRRFETIMRLLLHRRHGFHPSV